YFGAGFDLAGAVYVLDGATKTFSTLPLPSSPASGVAALAIDPSAHRLYGWLSRGTAPRNAIGVWDLAGNTFVTMIDISDMAGGTPTSLGLALDTTNHKLYACGAATAITPGAGCDTIDTTTNTVAAPQVTFDPKTDGYFVGVAGGPGGAILVTNGTTSSPAVI